MIRAFFIECSAPFWGLVVKEIQNRIPFTPIYWTGLPEYAEEIKSLNANIIFHDCTDAKRCVPAIAKNELPCVSMDDITINIWQEEAQIVFDMLNRFDFSKDFLLYDRTKYFHEALIYWYSVIELMQPDIIIFPNPPHVTYDYIIYCIAKRKNIKTVMFDQTAINTYSLTMEDFREGDKTLANAYRNKMASELNEPVILTEATRQYLERIKSHYALAKPILEQRVENTESSDTLTTQDEKQLQAILKADCDEFNEKKSPRPRNWLRQVFKQKNIDIKESFEGYFANYYYELARREWRCVNEKQKAQYNALAVQPDINQPYIYVALAGQPERTSCPQGNIYTYQYLMLHVLANSVPPGWKIYVKEHPNQLNPAFFGHMCRDEKYYEDITSLPNMFLVRTDTDPFYLIDSAKAVATIAGTTGWEAIIRGKPALIFGAAWYRHCAGVFYTPNVNLCKMALAEIAKGYKVNQLHVELYIAAVEETCFFGLSDPLPDDWFGCTNEENGKLLAKKILAHLQT